MIILDIKTQNSTPMKKGRSRKWLRGITKRVLFDTAEHWHQTIFPKHFTSANRSRYQTAVRNRIYRERIKPRKGAGQGKFVDLLLTGKSRRYMLALPQITSTSRKATVTMKPPAYFTNPHIGSFVDPRTGKQKRITQQPDKVEEATRVSEDDKRLLREFAATRMHKYANEPLPTTTTRTKG